MVYLSRKIFHSCPDRCVDGGQVGICKAAETGGEVPGAGHARRDKKR